MIRDDQRGTTRDDLVCVADIMPTCLAAAGVKPPRDLIMDGTDLLSQPGHEFVVGACGDQLGVVEGQWKYLYTTSGGAELMFNLADDPYEQKNLAGNARFARQRRQLQARLTEELGREEHEAVKNGKLLVLKPAPTRQECRANAWPGWHTRTEQSDLLH